MPTWASVTLPLEYFLPVSSITICVYSAVNDKHKCQLNNDDLALAKRLGLNPRSLIKNIPNKSEPWKAPIKDWLREIETKRDKKAAQKQKHKEKK